MNFSDIPNLPPLIWVLMFLWIIANAYNVYAFFHTMIVAIKSYKNDNLYRMLLVTIFLPSTAAFVIMYQLQLNADYTNFVYIVPILFMWWMGYKNDDPQARKLFKLNLIGMIGFCVTFLLLHISVGNGDYQKFLEIISSTAI